MNEQKKGLSISERICQEAITYLHWHRVNEWAKSKGQGLILGESCTNTNDPLSLFLGEMTNTPSHYWSIGPSIKYTGNIRLPKPAWITQLILSTDAFTHGTKSSITREDYLLLLQQVKPEEHEEQKEA